MSGFDTKWQATQKANPQLADETAQITMSILTLKRMLRKFYNAGEETVKPIAGGLEDLMNSIKKASGL
jgi:hypothetical protein